MPTVRRMIAAGAAVGVGFLAKMMQAFLVLPAFGVAYLVAAAVPLRTRLVRSAGAVARCVSGGWYLLLVELWPRPHARTSVGRRTTASSNWRWATTGIGRLTGEETGGLGNMNFDVGWGRLFGTSMGTYSAWLIPAAVICLAAGVIITRRAPRTDPARAA